MSRRARERQRRPLPDRHTHPINSPAHAGFLISGAMTAYYIKAYPFTEKPVESVTSADFIDWAMQHAPGRSPATLLNHMMAVRAAYRAAPVAHGIPLDMAVVTNAVDHLRRMQVVAPCRGGESQGVHRTPTSS